MNQDGVTIRTAESDGDLDQVRRLIGSFRVWLEGLYPDAPKSVDANFASVESELAGLPGDYASPRGRLLLATQGRTPVGMVAMRDLGDGRCEMKRLFVDPSHHGAGVGRALAEAVVSEARSAGYASMVLDTGRRQVAAIELYRRLGFVAIEPYYDVANEIREDLLFLGLPLSLDQSAVLDS